MRLPTVTEWHLVIVSRDRDRLILGGAIVKGTVQQAHHRAYELVCPNGLSDVVATSCMLDDAELMNFGARERAFDATEAVRLARTWVTP